MKCQETNLETASTLTLFSKLEKQAHKVIDQEWDYKKKVFGSLSDSLYFLLRSHAIIIFLLMLMVFVYVSPSIYPRIVSHIPILQRMDIERLPFVIPLMSIMLIILSPLFIVDTLLGRSVINDCLKKIYNKYRFVITPYFSIPILLYVLDAFILDAYPILLELYLMILLIYSVPVVMMWIGLIHIGPSNLIHMISIFSKTDYLDFRKRVLQKLNNSYQETLDKNGWERIRVITEQQATSLGLQNQLFSKLSVVLALISIFMAIIKEYISDKAITVIKYIQDFFDLHSNGQEAIIQFIFFTVIIIFIVYLVLRYIYFSYTRSHIYSIIGLFCQMKLEEIENAEEKSYISLSKRLGCHR
uniref:Uncharacterized protein n=1 Tax=Candidatus Kentrum sp. TUN TaxID=2126343 RepID=A0A450ZHI5_9GAMM|nr:MAG: hypothetical protein BECKTUN1418F_GA0071002_10121 [Candidatus Kentron sp. TUN]VFK53220.1 MAG: hypothetical protein BECKTUN1418E_GA0071001_10141 [Candidatus Kentron sp. TUN]